MSNVMCGNVSQTTISHVDQFMSAGEVDLSSHGSVCAQDKLVVYMIHGLYQEDCST